MAVVSIWDGLTPGIDQTTPCTWSDPGYVLPQMHVERWLISIEVAGRVVNPKKSSKNPPNP
jgi:hypothetical protein